MPRGDIIAFYKKTIADQNAMISALVEMNGGKVTIPSRYLKLDSDSFEVFRKPENDDIVIIRPWLKKE